ncbi:Potassium voltage-gated channel sub KQT member 4 [Blomia tropicalis]|nr:Potassium voltage-gated channel sub KQT member 4 [Blomia tropicalis]
MSRIERKLRLIKPRALYVRRRRNSADTMLMSSLAATDALVSGLNHQQDDNDQPTLEQENNNNNNSGTNNIKARSSTDDQTLIPSSSSTTSSMETSSATNRNRARPPPPIPIPPPPSIRTVNSNPCGSASHLEPPPTPTHSKSVIVNLSISGANLDHDKRRLSKLLREVNEMREIRDRHDSYASEQSLEANILKGEAFELKRINKIQRSKQLLFKYKVYDFLKRPASFGAMVYHVFAFILVAASLILSVYPALENHIGKLDVLDILEKTVLFWFTTEYILMLWASDCRPQYQGLRGKLVFIKSPAHLIDLLVIILSAALPSISSHDGHEVFAFRAFRGFHRFFQLLQVIALKRQLRPWQLFWSVLYDQREQLLIIFYLEIVLLCLLSYLGFLVEHEANENLENIADAMWWAVVTLTTVGYGDKTPITWLGKVISGCFILFGVAVFALPAGIIGAGLALKLEEVERSRQRRLKKEGAAKLIQRAWKCYRANHAYFELSAFFRHQPGDLFKVRVYDKITKAFIAMIQFHVAKSNFKELTRPVDLRSVIESYKYGQMDVFSRLKQLNSALDLIITRMTMAENERIVAMNQLAKKLQEMETISGVDDERMESPNLDRSNLGLRYLDLVHIPPMPQTSTHPSTIPLRSRPHSAHSHYNAHHSSPHVHQQPQLTHQTNHQQQQRQQPNYYSSTYRHNSQNSQTNPFNYNDHTIPTIDEDISNDNNLDENVNNSSHVIKDYDLEVLREIVKRNVPVRVIDQTNIRQRRHSG